jgi:hypothetical protein
MFHKITVDNIELGPIIRLMAVLFPGTSWVVF